MADQQYSVNQHPIQTLLSWVQSGEIAIPEIQRPFVWDAIKVRNLLDSLYQGFPIGYLIAWRNPKVRLKDGTKSEGKRILIDGQQRVTALMAAVLGMEVMTQDYDRVRIRIAFHPFDERFEVANPAIDRDAAWFPDVATVLGGETKLLKLVSSYCAKNKGAEQDKVFESLERLKSIVSRHVGLIELNPDLPIETVTEIFIRINSQGTVLSQADFAMSKIATNEKYGGNVLRKAIDYFCHLAKAPEFYRRIKEVDKEFTATDYFQQMAWLRKETEDIYDPTYTDMLRVAFTSQFRRGKLADLVALISGRNFKTKQYEDAISERSFKQLRDGVMDFMNESHFKRFLLIIKSAGFIDISLIGSQTALNVAYIIYLMLRLQKVAPAKIESSVRRWYAFSTLTGRYSGSPESTIDYDVRQIDDRGFDDYLRSTEKGELSSAFWDSALPQELDTSVASSPYFRLFQAAQVRTKDKGFLSRDITVQDLIEIKCDVHHLFPKAYLKKEGLSRGRYNQIANYVVTQSEINIAIGQKAPAVYFQTLLEQCDGGKQKYGGIKDIKELRSNFAAHCIPKGIEEMEAKDYDEFLAVRRNLMAGVMHQYYDKL